MDPACGGRTPPYALNATKERLSVTSDCRHCETEMAKEFPQLESLGSAESAFVHPGGYFSCRLYRCPRCATRWADVYHEWDDQETMLSEWGHVERFFRRLSTEQYETVAAARGRQSLDYRHFFSYGLQSNDAAAPSAQGLLDERVASLDAMEHGAALLDGIADAGATLAAYEQVLVARRALVEDAGTLATRMGLARTLLAVARARNATGDPTAALEALDECIRVAADGASSGVEIAAKAHSLVAALHLASGDHAAALIAADEGMRLGDETLDNEGGRECLTAMVECVAIRSVCLLAMERLDEAEETIYLGDTKAIGLEECGEEDPAALAACVRYWRARAALHHKSEEDPQAAEAEARAAQIEARLDE